MITNLKSFLMNLILPLISVLILLLHNMNEDIVINEVPKGLRVIIVNC